MDLEKLLKNTNLDSMITVNKKIPPVLPMQNRDGLLVPPLPVCDQKENISYNSGTDKFNNSYSYIYESNILRIRMNEIFDGLIEKLEKISSALNKIIIDIDSLNSFNKMCKLLSNTSFECQILLNINSVGLTDTFSLYRNSWMDFELLPDNVYVSNIGITENGEEKDYQYFGLDFNTWCLWLNDSDYSCVINRLAPKSKEKIENERKIAKKFYEIYLKCYQKENTDIEKVDFVYNWCRNNTRYAGDAIKADGNIRDDWHCAQDAVWTFVNKKGVCAGRARLFKLLLNNRYMQVECYLTSGMLGNLPHEWNEVYINGERRYYDLSFGIYGLIDIDENSSRYSNVQHEKFIKLMKR